MRLYTLSLLSKLSPDGSPIVETEILNWANQKLVSGGKDVQIKHFGDSVIKTALPILHLIDTIKSGVIDYKVIKNGTNLELQVCIPYFRSD